MAEDAAGSSTHQTPFELMENDQDGHAEEDDDFFDTAPDSNRTLQQQPQQYDLSSERFIFDGDDEQVVVVPSPSTSPYIHEHRNQPLLPDYLIPSYSRDEFESVDRWSEEYDFQHPLALPMDRLLEQPGRRRRRYEELSGLNYLNLLTFSVQATVFIVIGSGLIRHHWLPSTWTVTTFPANETLLTPSKWTGDFLWIPVLTLEGIFCVVQLLPQVRSRPQVVTGVSYSYFYIGMLQSLATLLFCCQCIIPAWIALAGTAVCLLYYQQKQQSTHLHRQSTTSTATAATRDDMLQQWDYWVFGFPFDFHLGWILPLLASRGSMIFRHYCGNSHVGLQLASDIVTMALLLSCAGAYLAHASTSSPRHWVVVPLLILWGYLGIACRLSFQPPHTLIDTYGKDVLVAIRDAAWCFAATVALLIVPRIIQWVAREFLTIHVVELNTGDDGDDVANPNQLEEYLLPSPTSGMSEF